MNLKLIKGMRIVVATHNPARSRKSRRCSAEITRSSPQAS